MSRKNRTQEEADGKHRQYGRKIRRLISTTNAIERFSCYRFTKAYYEVVSGESIAARPEIQKMLEEVSA